MGIDVRVESENGDLIAEVGDPQGRTALLLPDLSDPTSYCLRFVDPYGDATFNQLQIPTLIGEIRRQSEKIQDRPSKDHVDSILRLIETAQGSVHTYVRFIGD